jgi:hypothetical protein
VTTGEVPASLDHARDVVCRRQWIAGDGWHEHKPFFLRVPPLRKSRESSVLRTLHRCH